eukprot:GHVS01103695.1.p1 GENE.GHVS01103695.1~~GHVS01103695.1.p1  ORF type:complete len:426 (-),score=92.51 GHVS01103695.1:480-1757(-)
MEQQKESFCKSLDHTDKGVKGRVARFSALLKLKDRELWNHLHRLGVNPQFYAMRWILLWLTQEFEMVDVLSLWDAILSDNGVPLPLVYYLCVAIVLKMREALLAGDFTSSMKLLQHLPAFEPQTLLNHANAMRADDIAMGRVPYHPSTRHQHQTSTTSDCSPPSSTPMQTARTSSASQNSPFTSLPAPPLSSSSPFSSRPVATALSPSASTPCSSPSSIPPSPPPISTPSPTPSSTVTFSRNVAPNLTLLGADPSVPLDSFPSSSSAAPGLYCLDTLDPLRELQQERNMRERRHQLQIMKTNSKVKRAQQLAMEAGREGGGAGGSLARSVSEKLLEGKKVGGGGDGPAGVSGQRSAKSSIFGRRVSQSQRDIRSTEEEKGGIGGRQREEAEGVGKFPSSLDALNATFESLVIRGGAKGTTQEKKK